jgi:trimethylamine--corrinoid protein Co-methyltransferase
VPFQILSRDDITKIDRAAFTILQRPGIAVFERQSLDLLEKNGASVDRNSSRVKIPERLVRETLGRAPHRFKLAAREPSKSIVLGDGNTYFTNSATGIRVLDHRTGRIRESVLSDIPTFAKVADALPNMAFYGPTVVAHDVKGRLHFLKELVAGIQNTSKHVAHECQGIELSRLFAKIGQVIAGGEEELAKNPVISAGGCPVSPLQYDKANTEAMLECARAGIPYDVMSMAMGGGTSPITLAGELAMIHAEVLAGIVICQLARPGCPVIYGSVASVMDMRTGILALGAPERAILNAAVVQMAHHSGVPSLVGGISTDGKLPGDQAMLEKALTGLPAVLAGSDVVFGPAVLSSATTYSVEQLVVDDEAAGAMLRIKKGMTVDSETLALELIDKVGPGGGFMGTRHTLEHLRKDVWLPELADRNIFDNWARLGSKDMGARANDKVERILSKHQVKPIEKEQEREIGNILKEAEKHA